MAGRGGGVHERNAYALVLRIHPLPSFNINELGFSQFLLVFKGMSSRTLSTGAEHTKTLLRLLKGHLTKAKTERMRFFSTSLFFMRLLENFGLVFYY